MKTQPFQRASRVSGERCASKVGSLINLGAAADRPAPPVGWQGGRGPKRESSYSKARAERDKELKTEATDHYYHAVVFLLERAQRQDRFGEMHEKLGRSFTAPP